MAAGRSGEHPRRQRTGTTLRKFERFRAAMEQAGVAIALIDLEACSLPLREPHHQRNVRLSEARAAAPGSRRGSSATAMPTSCGATTALLEKPGHVEMEETSFDPCRRLFVPRRGSRAAHAFRRFLGRDPGRAYVTERHRNRAELERRMQELQRSNEELERFGYVASTTCPSPCARWAAMPSCCSAAMTICWTPTGANSSPS